MIYNIYICIYFFNVVVVVVVVYFSVLPIQALNDNSLFIACSSLVDIDGPIFNFVYYVLSILTCN